MQNSISTCRNVFLQYYQAVHNLKISHHYMVSIKGAGRRHLNTRAKLTLRTPGSAWTSSLSAASDHRLSHQRSGIRLRCPHAWQVTNTNMFFSLLPHPTIHLWAPTALLGSLETCFVCAYGDVSFTFLSLPLETWVVSLFFNSWLSIRASVFIGTHSLQLNLIQC